MRSLLSPFCLIIFLLLPGYLGTAAPLSLTSNDGESVDKFPAIKLRAYGTLSGEQKASAQDPQASTLLITCDNPAKAQLVLAKYLSDLGLLPGVSAASVTTPRGPVSAHQVDKEGVIAAVRCGAQVLIFTAADAAGLTPLVEAGIPAGTKVDASDAEIAVPMYVDRWDKYGFRFYYNPFAKPHDDQPYDPQQDFEFADKSQKTGLVLWNSPFPAATADGIFDLVSREWTYKAAQPHKLPLGINIGITDGNIVLTNRYPNGVAPNAPSYLGGWYYEAPSGIPTLAWSSGEAQEAGLGQLKNLVVGLNGKYDNIVNWLEPHEETSHGIADLLDDHGADAQKNFYAFLRGKYGSVQNVARRYGAHYSTWDDAFSGAGHFLRLQPRRP